MKALSIREAREELTKIEELLDKEGEVVLTRRGHPVARIVGISGRRQLPSRALLRKSLPYLARPSETVVGSERDER